MSKAVYILGGMGPQASLEFYRLVIEKSQKLYGAVDNDDYPEIILHSVPVPDFLHDETARQEAFAMLSARIEVAPAGLCDSFAIACNTAHLLADDLRSQTTIRFVSIIDETVSVLSRKQVKKIGLLASPVTIETRLYQDALEASDISTITPKKKELEQIEKAIRAVIASRDLSLHKARLAEIAENMMARGAESIVLGCTELPVMFAKDPPANFVSSTECLVDNLLDRYYNQKEA